jgi:hypothetical protein
VAAAAFPQLLKVQPLGILLVIVGGLLYTAGAVVYARRRPDPVPHVFGYHELFHVLTLGGVTCHYAAIAFFVLPRAEYLARRGAALLHLVNPVGEGVNRALCRHDQPHEQLIHLLDRWRDPRPARSLCFLVCGKRLHLASKDLVDLVT